MENIMKPPQKLKIELPYDSAIPLLGIYLKESKSGYNKDTCTYMFTHDRQAMETTQIPYNR
jgi:hypothetical protein